ncbi:MAG: glycosyltransferase family 2 protein [Promethearchaeota archaeon]
MLSIILVNYNNSDDTINCIRMLTEQTFQNFELIIVDNNSDHTERLKLKDFLDNSKISQSFKEKVRLKLLNSNTGFTGGCNYGIEISKKNLILLQNSDTYFNSEFLEIMLNFFRKHQFIHIAQPKICFHPNKSLIWSNGGKIRKYSFSLFGNLDAMERDNKKRKKPFRIDYAVGTSFFIKKHVLNEIGLLDKIYFMYCEESDLCYRASLKGYKIYCNPNCVIYHKIPEEFAPSFKKYYFRNRNIFCFKFFPFPILLWQTLVQFIQLFIYTIDRKKKKIDYNFLFSSIKGIVIGLKVGIIKRKEYKKFKLTKKNH